MGIKLTDIELQMIIDDMKEIMPLHIKMAGEVAKLASAYYVEYKKQPDVEPSDVISLSVKSALTHIGFNN
ncbi:MULTISPECIES: hypothetical protein [Bacillus]|uniref:hypothetical protein n=1 Tax=Bacillus TaxID=1386 RepID=UPI001B3A207B|nr:hypothetical protein [Bacillus pumilus]MBQ4815783.1 hypothetical protein [Bacillus pumilus]